MAAQLDLKGILLPSFVSLAASYQLTTFARAVGQARMKFKVSPPATDGDEGFVRAFRAQQNSLEFAPIFYPTVWISSIFFHPVPTALASLGYLYARHKYFHQYSKDTESRLQPFLLSVKFIQILIMMSAAGLISFSLKSYMDVDIPGKVMDFIGPYIKS